MKTIVTHISPDLDAISSIWLIHRFMRGWSNAEVKLVPAGTTLDSKAPDIDPNIIHVDTGFGNFDHHQNNEDTCAAKKVFLHLKNEKTFRPNQVEPVERMIDVVNEIDHFREVFLDEADKDIYDINIVNIIEGMRNQVESPDELITLTENMLDGLQQIFSNKVNAEKEIKNGFIFKSKWGKTLATVTDNEEVVRLAQKKGFSMVIRKNGKNGYLRVKTLPLKKLNLEKLFNILKEKDPKAFWFFHSSGNMILNGSAKNPNTVATKLSLNEVVEIVKNIV
jgi:hypothetical protein